MVSFPPASAALMPTSARIAFTLAAVSKFAVATGLLMLFSRVSVNETLFCSF
jgi:hypothetical protein